jgi:hypothetical protein
MDIFERTSAVLNSCLMLAVWSVPFFMSVWIAHTNRVKMFYLLACAFLIQMLYFMWAISDVWSTHEAAVTFNRTTDIASVLLLMLFLVGMYGRKSR